MQLIQAMRCDKYQKLFNYALNFEIEKNEFNNLTDVQNMTRALFTLQISLVRNIKHLKLNVSLCLLITNGHNCCN